MTSGARETRNIVLNLLALSALRATLLVITVMPGSSILDLDIDVASRGLRRIHGLGTAKCRPAGEHLHCPCGVLTGKLEHRPSTPGGPRDLPGLSCQEKLKTEN
jgi:hypothetical protein